MNSAGGCRTRRGVRTCQCAETVQNQNLLSGGVMGVKLGGADQ